MNATNRPPEAPVVDVVVAYEGGDTRVSVAETLSELSGPEAEEVRERTTEWKFSVLETPLMLRQAVEDAIKADVIIVCARGESDLPEAVKRWIGQWLPQRGARSRSLVGLLDAWRANEETAARIFGFLKTAASSGHLNWHGRYVEFEDTGFCAKARLRL